MGFLEFPKNSGNPATVAQALQGSCLLAAMCSVILCSPSCLLGPTVVTSPAPEAFESATIVTARVWHPRNARWSKPTATVAPDFLKLLQAPGSPREKMGPYGHACVHHKALLGRASFIPHSFLSLLAFDVLSNIFPFEDTLIGFIKPLFDFLSALENKYWKKY